MSEYICPAAPEVTHCYNAKAVRELIRQARMDALEEAASWLESVPAALPMRQELAAAIRSLKEKTP